MVTGAGMGGSWRLVFKAGGGLAVGSESSRVRNVYYDDPSTGTYRVWESCLAGAP